jgi:hypothetical protein
MICVSAISFFVNCISPVVMHIRYASLYDNVLKLTCELSDLDSKPLQSFPKLPDNFWSQRFHRCTGKIGDFVLRATVEDEIGLFHAHIYYFEFVFPNSWAQRNVRGRSGPMLVKNTKNWKHRYISFTLQIARQWLISVWVIINLQHRWGLSKTKIRFEKKKTGNGHLRHTAD